MRRKILLIDDDVNLHHLAKAFLEKENFQLVSAYSGSQGLRLILEQKPNIILLDFLLPDRNGDQVYRELKSNFNYSEVSQTPVIILTGKEFDPALRDHFLEQGIGVFLQKPFGLRELLNVIENVLVISEINLKNQRLQLDLLKTQDELELLINTIPIGLVSTDKKGKILKLNSFFGKIVGDNSAEHILNKNIFDFDLFKSPEVNHLVSSILQEGKAVKTEPFDFIDPHGRRYKLILSGIPLAALNRQQDHGTIFLIQDVTRSIQREHGLAMIARISDFMQGAMSLDELLHLILTAVTAGCAMGFSRAMILLKNPEKLVLQGRMGVGPVSGNEAYRIWNELSKENIPLPRFLEKFGRKVRTTDDDPINQLIKQITVPLSWNDCLLIQALNQKQSLRLDRDKVKVGIAPELLDKLNVGEFIVVPLIANNNAIGIVVADNQFSNQVIDDERMNLLTLFANQAGLAIERAETYARLEEEKNKLQKTYEELKMMQDQLLHSKRLATIGEMVAHVAHEIRNPLVTIGGFARKIQKTALRKNEKELQNASGIIVEEVSRLEKILTNMLDFSKFSRPQPQLTNINEIIDETCMLMGLDENNSGKGIHLQKELDDTLPQILVDRQQIKQVLINLIQNAISFMPEDGQLHLAARREFDVIRVSVIDSGAGIAPENLEELFNPFYTTKANGTGLGLPISQQIIKSHGGTIEVQSKIGKGTTFSFTLRIVDNITDFSHFPDQDSF
ncbi:MAG TPA: ATP-binding protein [bacterium]